MGEFELHTAPLFFSVVDILLIIDFFLCLRFIFLIKRDVGNFIFCFYPVGIERQIRFIGQFFLDPDFIGVRCFRIQAGVRIDFIPGTGFAVPVNIVELWRIKGVSVRHIVVCIFIGLIAESRFRADFIISFSF